MKALLQAKVQELFVINGKTVQSWPESLGLDVGLKVKSGTESSVRDLFFFLCVFQSVSDIKLAGSQTCTYRKWVWHWCCLNFLSVCAETGRKMLIRLPPSLIASSSLPVPERMSRNA